jgi:hypothetical protein
VDVSLLRLDEEFMVCWVFIGGRVMKISFLLIKTNEKFVLLTKLYEKLVFRDNATTEWKLFLFSSKLVTY